MKPTKKQIGNAKRRAKNRGNVYNMFHSDFDKYRGQSRFDHLPNTVQKNNMQSLSGSGETFGNRLQRVRSSLEKINCLMGRLRGEK